MRYLNTLRRIYWTAQLKYQGEAPLIEKLRWWRRGFRPASTWMYRFPRPDMCDYVNDYSENFPAMKFNPVAALFQSKILQCGILQAAGATLPELLAVVHRGRTTLHPLTRGARPATPAELERVLLADGDEFILKPDYGAGGDKVALIRADDGKLLCQSREAWRPFRFDQPGQDVFLVQRRARQAPFWGNLYPGSLNTMRVLTLWPDGDPAPFIAAAAQRIGNHASAPVDNFSRGGFAASIDPETGRIGSACRADAERERVTHHPETGSPIEGQTVPHWPAIRTEVLRLAGAMPFNRLVGWDAFVTPDGRVAICEINGARVGVQILQLERGLLADARVRRFYEQQQAL
jgi:putative polysaccharide biosynthesis protein